MTESGRFWIVLYTQPHKERMVRDYLENEGFRVYLPEIRNKIQRSDRRSKRPFFPHYLFIKGSDEDKIAEIRWTPGLRSVVSFGGRPALVPDKIVEHIRERLKTYEISEEELYKSGERIRVASGPFEGLDVIFDRRLSEKERVRVFLELMSKIQVPVEMDLKDLLPPY